MAIELQKQKIHNMSHVIHTCKILCIPMTQTGEYHARYNQYLN